MRINVINPKYLTDQHLIAEYRETKMITYYYNVSKNKKGGIDKSKINERYTLSKGHAFMWYDKMGYVAMRFEDICREMRERGFKCDYDKLDFTGIDEEAFGNFIPTQEDIRVNLDRVLIRLAKQPMWYKFHKKNIQDWNSFYEDLYSQNKLLTKYN